MTHTTNFRGTMRDDMSPEGQMNNSQDISEDLREEFVNWKPAIIMDSTAHLIADWWLSRCIPKSTLRKFIEENSWPGHPDLINVVSVDYLKKKLLEEPL